MNTPAAIAAELGALVETKNAAYGDSAAKVAGIMAILYPNGIAVEQYRNALLTVRVLDKLGRISQGAMEDSWEDVAGYGILGAYLNRNGGSNGKR